MPKRWSHLAPLSGLVFVVLVAVATLSSHTTPASDASPAKVIAFYEAHRSSQRAVDILFVVGFAFFLFFAGTLRGALRAESEGAATTALAGAVLLATGIGLLSMFDYALADHPDKLTPAAAQALSLLSNDAYPVAAAGALVFGVSAGFALLRSSLLPRWLGWAVLAFGVIAATPASIIGLLGLLLWTLVVAILLLRRGAPPNVAA
jgi:hypothetical protein